MRTRTRPATSTRRPKPSAPPPPPTAPRRGARARAAARAARRRPPGPAPRLRAARAPPALAAGARVEAVPGPSALLAALVVSGLPPQPFTFAGFPPPKSGKRRTFYRVLEPLAHTVIVFESPHRLLASLEDALAELGERPT